MLSLFESWCRSHVSHPDGLPDERNLGSLTHDWKLVEVRPDGMPPYKYTCTGGCLQVSNAPYDAFCPDKVAAAMRRLYDYIHQQDEARQEVLRICREEGVETSGLVDAVNVALGRVAARHLLSMRAALSWLEKDDSRAARSTLASALGEVHRG
jgi:hypothetical protein